MKHDRALVIGNWKLNPGTCLEAKKLFVEIKKNLIKDKNNATEVVIAPPFLFISELYKLTNEKITLAAQDVHYEERGSVTGEIGPAMLASYGIEYVIVGHSERRALGETDIQINKKIQALLKRKMTPVVCIGEAKRDQQGNFFNHLTTQLKELSAGLTALQLSKVVIAYEPIWAIGTGQNASPEDVKEIQLFIVSALTKLFDRKTAEKVKLIYGGSVKESNAEALHRQGGMSGFLVGGSSLQAKDFCVIVRTTEIKK